MKIRHDFVTNSSSSAFICLRLPIFNVSEILAANNLSDHKIEKMMEDGKCYDSINLKGKNIIAALNECGVDHIGWELSESILADKTLNQLRIELAEEVESTYGIQIPPKEIEFDYGEIYR